MQNNVLKNKISKYQFPKNRLAPLQKTQAVLASCSAVFFKKLEMQFLEICVFEDCDFEDASLANEQKNF